VRPTPSARSSATPPAPPWARARRLVALGAGLALAACGSAPGAGSNPSAGGDGAPPIDAPCPTPPGETLEHWREAPEAGLVALKTRDGVGRSHTHYRDRGCGSLTEDEALARLDAAARGRWRRRVDAVPDDTLVVQVWLGSVREADRGFARGDLERARDARFAALQGSLRRLLAPIPGSFAYVGRLAKADARLLAAEPAVRWLFAYAAIAAPAPAEVARAVAAVPGAPGGIAVFDECAEEGTGLERASYGDAVGAACLRSAHGTAVSRLAFQGGAAAEWSAGLTAASTDAPESLASPALWALGAAGARVLVQTIHTVAGEDANDALDTLVAEAAYPHALVVRAGGNGLAADPVVHRVLGGLDVGAVGAGGRPLASMRTANAGSAFGDVERPSLVADGVADAADGAPEGTSFAAPRVGAAAAAALAGVRPEAPSAAARVRAHLLATASEAPCAQDLGAAQRRHEDAAVGAGVVAGAPAGAGIVLLRAEDFDAHGRVRMDLPHTTAPGLLRAALVFRSAAGAHPLDPARSRADLDLRVVDATGATIAASQSFDDDQEVTSFSAARARAIVVERANGEPFFDAVLAIGAHPDAGRCGAR
jgi:hypothetical protein